MTEQKRVVVGVQLARFPGADLIYLLTHLAVAPIHCCIMFDDIACMAVDRGSRERVWA